MERLLVGLVLGGLFTWAAARALRRDRQRRRLSRSRTGEKRAVRLARRAGYHVIDEQVQGQLTMWVDGKAQQVDLRADLLLERRGRRYIGEVKTGKRAPDPTHRGTRRQLMEYAAAFGSDGVLLFDMEADRIHEVRFSSPRSGWPRVIRLVGAAGVGAAALALASELGLVG